LAPLALSEMDFITEKVTSAALPLGFLRVSVVNSGFPIPRDDQVPSSGRSRLGWRFLRSNQTPQPAYGS
jgi:hypothetical protein